MPAESKAQRGLMSLALSVKRGETKLEDVPERIRGQVARIAKTMSLAQLEDFAGTKEKGLPRHKGQRTATRRVRSA